MSLKNNFNFLNREQKKTKIKVKLNVFIKLFRIVQYLNFKRKFQLVALFIISFMTALSEVLTLASFYPFLSILSNINILNQNPITKAYINYFKINNDDYLLLHFTSIFCISILIAAVIRLTNLWLSLKLSAIVGNDIAKIAYRKTLYQSYQVHINRNTSNLISALTKEIDRTTDAINSTVQTFTSILIFFSILFFILFLNWRIALLTAISVGALYLVMALSLNRILKFNSKVQVESNFLIIKEIREALNSIRDVILDNTQEFYLKSFVKFDRKLKLTIASNSFIGIFPRYSIEALALAFISIVAFTLAKDPINKLTLFPLLGAFALGAQRLLPAIQQIYLNWSVIKSCQNSISVVLKLLNQPQNKIEFKSTKRYNFKESLILKNISFTYEGTKIEVLKDINLEIFKGEKIGIIGESGSGKSTLVDIIMGLLTPTKGELLIDGKNIYGKEERSFLASWRLSLAHVPQNIFLADSNFENNIALGVPNSLINIEKIKLAARSAQIHDFVNGLEGGYKTNIGEDGIKLSGGQRQRIGIARALYKNAKVLILDEATSSLDNKTELSFMNSIDKISNKITLIIVAHRLTTLKNCDRIITISDGRITNIEF
tara:strand:- start:2299 stop:4110 length:1812 start_codon:yes stop_codon:yes gene_type:complete